LGYKHEDEIIHKDNLVLLDEEQRSTQHGSP